MGLLWLLSYGIFSRYIHVVVLVLHFFLRSCSILCYRYATFHLTIHRLMDIRVVSSFWLLWIMLPCLFMYELFCGHIFSFLLAIQLGAGLLGLPLAIRGTGRLFFKVTSSFHISITLMCENSDFVPPCQHLSYLSFWLLPS